MFSPWFTTILMFAFAFPLYRHNAIDITSYGATLRFPGAVVRDVTYSSPVSGRITAYVVNPTTGTSHAGVLYAHWAIGNRSEFLPEAIALARRYSVVSVLPDAPQFRPAPWTHAPDGNIAHPERDVALYRQAVIDLRRSLDVLTAQKGVDKARIAVVGHSFDAAMAGVLSGVDHRPKLFVLMAGSGRTSLSKSAYEGSFFSEQSYKQLFTAFSRKALERYVTVVSIMDADRYVHLAAPAKIFMQFGSQDPYVTRWSALDYYAAASRPKSMKWYAGGHELMSTQAVADRTAALVSTLHL